MKKEVRQVVTVHCQPRSNPILSGATLLGPTRPIQKLLAKVTGLLILLISYMVGFADVAVASPMIPVVVTTCDTCNNQATLQAAALAYFRTWADTLNTPVAAATRLPQ